MYHSPSMQTIASDRLNKNYIPLKMTYVANPMCVYLNMNYVIYIIYILKEKEIEITSSERQSANMLHVKNDDSASTVLQPCYALYKLVLTHAPLHISDFKGVHARYVKRTGLRPSVRNAQVKGWQPLRHSFVCMTSQ